MAGVVVGIAGASCSGKSSTASALCAALGTQCLVSQDDFFVSEDKAPTCVLNGVVCTDWDCEGALDLHAFALAVEVRSVRECK